MKPRFPLTGADKRAPDSAGRRGTTCCQARQPGMRACCCPAFPVVRSIMPPTAERRHSIDLPLCGHHYRVSRQALAAAGARIKDLPGKADRAQECSDAATHQARRRGASRAGPPSSGPTGPA